MMYIIMKFSSMAILSLSIIAIEGGKNYRAVKYRDKLNHKSTCDVYMSNQLSWNECGNECNDQEHCLHFTQSGEGLLPEEKGSTCYMGIKTTHSLSHSMFTKTATQNIETVLAPKGKIFEKNDIINECLSNPCVHGNCDDREDGYFCICNIGYTGTTCNQVIDCGSLSNPNDGSVSTNKNTYGGQATYTCNTGHNLVGSSLRICEETASWNGSAPTCQVVDCGSIPSLPNGAGAVTKTTYQGQVSYSCNTGYDLSGNSARTCQATGSWSGSHPTCNPKNCGSLSSISYGSVQSTKNTYQGVATYSCNTGYTMSGNSQRTCQSTGTWSGSTPSCNIVNCGSLSNPSYGSVSTNANTYGGTATYSCNSGYIIQGSSQRTCQSSGSWSNSAPTCKVSGCSSVSLSYGSVSVTSYSVGGVATFTCNSGYARTGNRQRTCQSNGYWSGSGVTCKSVPSSYSVISNTVSCSSTGFVQSGSQQIFTCDNIIVSGSQGTMKIVNYDTCTAAWKSFSSITGSTLTYLDVNNLCYYMMKYFWSSPSISNSNVYWSCDSSQLRYTFKGGAWGTRSDNGYLKAIQCIINS